MSLIRVEGVLESGYLVSLVETIDIITTPVGADHCIP